MEMKHLHVNPVATERSEHGEVTVETGVNFGELYEEVIIDIIIISIFIKIITTHVLYFSVSAASHELNK